MTDYAEWVYNSAVWSSVPGTASYILCLSLYCTFWCRQSEVTAAESLWPAKPHRGGAGALCGLLQVCALSGMYSDRGLWCPDMQPFSLFRPSSHSVHVQLLTPALLSSELRDGGTSSSQFLWAWRSPRSWCWTGWDCVFSALSSFF